MWNIFEFRTLWLFSERTRKMREEELELEKEEEIKIWGKKGPDGKPECSDGGCSSCGTNCH